MTVYIRALKGLLFLDVGVWDEFPKTLTTERVLRKYFDGDEGVPTARMRLANASQELRVSKEARALLETMQVSSSDYPEDIAWEPDDCVVWFGSAGTMIDPAVSKLGRGSVLPTEFTPCADSEGPGSEGDRDREMAANSYYRRKG